jgi:proline racemase
MEFTRTYTTIDAHTAGEPLRIITSGLPFIPGATMLERRRYMREHLDHARQTLLLEPRGHADMYGAILTPPVSGNADFGVIFLHNEGYSSMCGHGVIALATVAVATGMVMATVGETRVGLDTPAGFVEAFAEWNGRKVGRVRFRNVPSFVYHNDLEIQTASFGKLLVDVVFGGAFYAYLNAAQAHLEVRPNDYANLIKLGHEVKHAVEAVCKVVHPLEPELHGIYGAMIDGEPFSGPKKVLDPQAAPKLGSLEVRQSNVCVFADRQVDRSPTGTGTAGRVAQLFAQGKLARGQTLINESIVGTAFEGRVLEETRVADFPAVIPEVSGCASVTGYHTFVVDVDDPLPNGFFLR